MFVLTLDLFFPFFSFSSFAKTPKEKNPPPPPRGRPSRAHALYPEFCNPAESDKTPGRKDGVGLVGLLGFW